MSESSTQVGSSFRGHLVALIGLLYGLAIATGTGDAISHWFDQHYSGDKHQMLLLSAAAFLLGVADFVIYHLTIAKCSYRSVTRLVLDLGFPTLIFVLFNITADLGHYLLLLLLYFIGTHVYLYLLKKDQCRMSRLYWLTVAFLTMPVVLAYVQTIRSFWPWIGQNLVIVIVVDCFFYFVVNMILANQELKMTVPRRT